MSTSEAGMPVDFFSKVVGGECQDGSGWRRVACQHFAERSCFHPLLGAPAALAAVARQWLMLCSRPGSPPGCRRYSGLLLCRGAPQQQTTGHRQATSHRPAPAAPAKPCHAKTLTRPPHRNALRRARRARANADCCPSPVCHRQSPCAKQQQLLQGRRPPLACWAARAGARAGRAAPPAAPLAACPCPSWTRTSRS